MQSLRAIGDLELIAGHKATAVALNEAADRIIELEARLAPQIDPDLDRRLKDELKRLDEPLVFMEHELDLDFNLPTL